MADIRTFEEATLQAREKLAKWREEYEAKFYRPLGSTLTATLLQSLPPEVRAKLAEMKPPEGVNDGE